MRPADQIDRVRAGVVGEFVPIVDATSGRFLPGSVKLGEDVVVAKLLADDEVFDHKGFPIDAKAVGGRTEAGDVLLADIRSRGRDRGNLDVARYQSNCLVVGVNLQEVDHDTLTGVRFAYHGLYDWLSDRIYHDDSLVEDGEYVGWKAELRFGKGVTVHLNDGFRLRFGAGWSVGGDFDRRTFATPLTITVESDARKPIHEHLVRLDAIHALLNLAHREPVRSFGGFAKLTANSTWCGLWETNMMSADAGDAATQSSPYFGLEAIGGIESVANWIAIVLNHRRAVAPVVRHTLEPNQTPESRLLSTAAAMEAWVAAHRRTDQWAKRIKNEDLPGALIRKVDRGWDTWIGDSDDWLRTFWSSYNHLKHQSQDDLDPQLVHVLEVSGRWLLTAALLDEAAGTTEPSRYLFGESSLLYDGNFIRATLADAN